jgi:hypothetical protein
MRPKLPSSHRERRSFARRPCRWDTGQASAEADASTTPEAVTLLVGGLAACEAHRSGELAP